MLNIYYNLCTFILEKWLKMSVIFLDDFEITENTEFFHSIIGRCLILSSRFESLCKDLYIRINMPLEIIKSYLNKEKDQNFSENLLKYKPLNNILKNIEPYINSEELNQLFQDAKKARNDIAHEFCVNLSGCIDLKVTNDSFYKRVEELIKPIIRADYYLSTILHYFNKDGISLAFNIYHNNVVEWVFDVQNKMWENDDMWRYITI